MSINPKIKVIIVDDSLLVRNIIADILSAENDIEVVATGKTGVDCIELAKKLSPDFIVLDIEMPIMDGLSALAELKKSRINIPVIMLSVLTQHGAEATFKALELGAIDFIPKPSAQMQMDTKEIGKILISKIRGTWESNNQKYTRLESPKLVKTISSTSIDKEKNKGFQKSIPLEAICIGTSTGGPRALQTVFQGFPEGFKLPVFVVQHMPAGFTKAFAERMNTFSKLHVKEAENGEEVIPGYAYIAPGDLQMKITSKSGNKFIELQKTEAVNGHRPSIEVLFDSARTSYSAPKLVAVIMTGMGKDGSEAIKRIREENGFTIAQDEQSSVIFGMNRVAIELGGIERITPVENITKLVIDVVKERG
jgi:two-component system chemotaxis response regulator CheB